MHSLKDINDHIDTIHKISKKKKQKKNSKHFHNLIDISIFAIYNQFKNKSIFNKWPNIVDLYVT